jgi:anti-sigma factor RsiW
MNSAQHLANNSLNAWLDHDIATDERAVLEAHLAACTVCRQEAEELAAVKSTLANLPQHEPPRSFRLTPEQAEHARTTARSSTIIRLLPTVRALSIAAVMALLIVAGAITFGPIADDGDVRGEISSTVESSQTQDTVGSGGAPGEVVDQGQAASADNGSVDPLAPASQDAADTTESIANASPAPANDSDDGRSPLELTAIGLGILAVVLVGLWILLTRLSRFPRVR